MTPRSVRITGWGMYAPERRLTFTLDEQRRAVEKLASRGH